MPDEPREPDEDEERLLVAIGSWNYLCPECRQLITAYSSAGVVQLAASHMVLEHPMGTESKKALAIAIDPFLPLGQSRATWALALMGDADALQELLDAAKEQADVSTA